MNPLVKLALLGLVGLVFGLLIGWFVLPLIMVGMPIFVHLILTVALGSVGAIAFIVASANNV